MASRPVRERPGPRVFLPCAPLCRPGLPRATDRQRRGFGARTRDDSEGQKVTEKDGLEAARPILISCGHIGDKTQH